MSIINIELTLGQFFVRLGGLCLSLEVGLGLLQEVIYEKEQHQVLLVLKL